MLYSLTNFCLQFWALIFCVINIACMIMAIIAIVIGLPMFVISKIEEFKEFWNE